MFIYIIALLLQLGTINSAADFNPNEYDERANTYQQNYIIKDEIVYWSHLDIKSNTKHFTFIIRYARLQPFVGNRACRVLESQNE